MESNTQKTLLLKKEGRYVYITNRTLGKTIRFDLATKLMERKNKKTFVWEEVQHQFSMFRKLTMDNIDYEDHKFKKLLELSVKFHDKKRSLSTYITTLSKVLVFEPYIQQGFKCSVMTRRKRSRYYGGGYENEDIELPKIQEIPKPYLEMLKERNIEITNNFYYDASNSKMWTDIFGALKVLDLSQEQKNDIYENLDRYYVKDAWNYLVNEKNFQPRALIGYLSNYLYKFEGLDFNEAITALKDYYRMANRIGRNVQKYPKYLKSMHDIIQSNFKAFKKEYDLELFTKVIKPELEYKSKDYQMLNPTKPEDIIQEGTDNNHCVGSYVDDIISERTYIIFLRKNDTKEYPEESKKSLITVELDLKNKELIQARGAYNRAPTLDEKEFMEEYAKKMELEVTY